MPNIYPPGLTPANGPGLAYTAINQNYTIAPDTLVASNDDDGVHSSFADSDLHNFGTVISGSGDDGVSFTAGGFVENGSTGLIIGSEFGISVTGELAGDTSVVINAGSVQSGLYAVIVSSLGEALFSNTGSVSGLFAGAYVMAAEGARVVNSGTIEGNIVGLGVITLATQGPIEIINTGTIKVGNLIPDIESGALFAGGGDGAVNLQNSGTIVGKVVLAADAAGATVTNSGVIDGETLLGDGNDRFDGTKGTQGAVFGQDGSDKIIGGVGADVFDGGLGNDTLKGRDGIDQFWFTTDPSSKTNRDTILDYKQADGDKIVLDRDIFAGLGNSSKLKAKYFETGKKPESKNDKIVYNEKNGVLLYAENGSKTDKADWVKFAQLDKGTDLDHAGFLLV